MIGCFFHDFFSFLPNRFVVSIAIIRHIIAFVNIFLLF
nr:MAG TPA: hypothetical protein [Caudoviricetes sp.]